MNESGFRLRSLTLTGNGVADAAIQFNAGLNVIVGPSDTGKTFIAQCIDYMFGAANPPKSIPESESYETVRLEISSYSDGKSFTLERSLRGGKFRLFVEGKDDQILAEKHKAGDENNISHFLLALCGLENRKLRKNARGTTKALSFRDIARLILIDEKKVIREDSPIYSGQRQDRTAEQNVFRLLLTGTDDSSIVEQPDPKVSKGRVEGKTEVIESLIDRLNDELSSLPEGKDAESIRDQLDRIETSYREASDALSSQQQSVATIEQNRRAAWTRVRKIDSRIGVLTELRNRFALLREQYSSDLRRLESIAETGVRLGEMNEERCPVCGARAEHHSEEHRKQHSSPEDVASASIAEAVKTRGLLADLESTILDTIAELESLQRERRDRESELNSIRAEMTDSLQPRLQEALDHFRSAQSHSEPLLRALGLFERLHELEQMLEVAHEKPDSDKAEGLKGAVESDEADKFCKEVEMLLQEWKFPNVDRVTFGERDQDIVISGRKRASHGKGVRAITHSSFTLGLMHYCRRESKPHTGMVLIDSPLVVYREPDPDEGSFSVDVKEAFYRSLAEESDDVQVIVLENDPPPVGLESEAHVITFTGNELGRWGFIPRLNSEAL